MKQTINIEYNPCDWGNNLYIEDVTYIENEKQCVRSTLMEIDPAELEEKYESILNKSNGLAMFRERPITPLNIIEVSVRAAVFDERPFDEKMKTLSDFLFNNGTYKNYDHKWDLEELKRLEHRYDHDRVIQLAQEYSQIEEEQ